MSRALALAALLVLALAGPAAAVGAPEIETVQFVETEHDEFLTEACGVPVSTIIRGRITFMQFGEEPVGPNQIVTINASVVSIAGDNSVRYRDVGIDLFRVEPDGTLVFMLVGQIPLGFTGLLMTDLETGETIVEPQHVVDVESVCELLTA